MGYEELIVLWNVSIASECVVHVFLARSIDPIDPHRRHRGWPSGHRSISIRRNGGFWGMGTARMFLRTDAVLGASEHNLSASESR